MGSPIEGDERSNSGKKLSTDLASNLKALVFEWNVHSLYLWPIPES